jgi:hypothetical protein
MNRTMITMVKADKEPSEIYCYSYHQDIASEIPIFIRNH